ncbi:MAG: CDP-alcohol phosphatidyltransferase family protein [Anaerolineales bacterium]|nr:CDP-alcohol phosphatidyltransferase family protein [Anaerolineales bacterium]
MPTDESADEPRPTLTDQVRARYGSFADPIAAFFLERGITPNTMTLIGLGGNFIGSIFLALGEFLIGGLIILVMGPFDAIDGAMARQSGETSKFGAFVDSVTDRYSELLILGGLMAYYVRIYSRVWVLVTFLAIVGSIMVSYVRARAESLDYDAKIGIMTRMERYLILAPTTILSIPHIGISIIAVFANFTAFQRIWSVRKQAQEEEDG